MGLLWSRLVTPAVSGPMYPCVDTTDLVEMEYALYLDKWRTVISLGVDLPREIISIIHDYVAIESKNEYFIRVLMYRELRVDHCILRTLMCSATITLVREPSGMYLTIRMGGTPLLVGSAETPMYLAGGQLLKLIETNKLRALMETMLKRTVNTFDDWQPRSVLGRIDLADECNYLLGEICTMFRLHASIMLAFGDGR